MITSCKPDDFDSMLRVINDAARVYKGAIPADCWHEPYMSREYLEKEINRGVVFYGSTENGNLAGVMGIQDAQDVTLIRHAYVLTALQRSGIGGELLAILVKKTGRPVLIGTWKAATWAVSFYQKHGFTLVNEETKNKLLKKYWTIPERQIETSAVLADKKWITGNISAG